MLSFMAEEKQTLKAENEVTFPVPAFNGICLILSPAVHTAGILLRICTKERSFLINM